MKGIRVAKDVAQQRAFVERLVKHQLLEETEDKIVSTCAALILTRHAL